SYHLHLHSFPTRRSSVLLHFLYIHRQTDAFIGAILGALGMLILSLAFLVQAFSAEFLISMLENTETTSLAVFLYKGIFLEGALRSEEHTSELQSRFDLVC